MSRMAALCRDNIKTGLLNIYRKGCQSFVSWEYTTKGYGYGTISVRLDWVVILFDCYLLLLLIISSDKRIFYDHFFHLSRINRSLFGIDDFPAGFYKNSVRQGSL